MSAPEGTVAEPESPWRRSDRADPAAVRLADRHYNRQKPGSPQFVPPGRCLVLLTEDRSAVWVTSWPLAKPPALAKVGDHRFQEVGGISHPSHDDVATGAGQAPNTARGVVMFYAETRETTTQDPRLWLATNGADAALALQHGVVLRDGHAVLAKVVGGPISRGHRDREFFPSVQRDARATLPAEPSSAGRVGREVSQRLRQPAGPAALLRAQCGKFLRSSAPTARALARGVFPSLGTCALNANRLQAICSVWRSMKVRYRDSDSACWAVLAALSDGHGEQATTSPTRMGRDPGRCYRRAGFVVAGATKGGLVALQMLPDAMPEAVPVPSDQLELWSAA